MKSVERDPIIGSVETEPNILGFVGIGVRKVDNKGRVPVPKMPDLSWNGESVQAGDVLVPFKQVRDGRKPVLYLFHPRVLKGRPRRYPPGVVRMPDRVVDLMGRVLLDQSMRQRKKLLFVGKGPYCIVRPYEDESSFDVSRFELSEDALRLLVRQHEDNAAAPDGYSIDTVIEQIHGMLLGAGDSTVKFSLRLGGRNVTGTVTIEKRKPENSAPALAPAAVLAEMPTAELPKP